MGCNGCRNGGALLGECGKMDQSSRFFLRWNREGRIDHSELLEKKRQNAS